MSRTAMRAAAMTWALALGLMRVEVCLAAEATASDSPAKVAAGHSLHGEAFDHGPRQKAYLMEGTGKVSFPITSKSAEAQAFFNQGVGQLHGFWYFEAERSFRQTAALDPDCAMSYWGMAMANVNNAKRAKSFIAEATRRKASASRREQLYIDALAAFHDAAPDKDKDRRRAYVRQLEAIVQEFPDDVEAKAFLAVQLWDNDGRGWPIGSHQAVDSLLDQVFAANPTHPAHHYRIHLWDREKPERALASAAACGPASPAIAHMWHMPGHIYSDLQRYADASWMQEASARVDHAHMMRDRVLPDQIHNYAHNNEWLIRDLMFVGRAHDAVSLSKNLIELPRHPQYNSLKLGGQCSAKYGRERLVQALMRFELWDELIALSDSMYLEPTDVHAEKIVRLRARGVAFFSKGLLDHGKAEMGALEAMLAQETADQQAAGQQAEQKARDEKKPDDQVAKAKQAAIQPFVGRMEPLKPALAELAVLTSLAAGDTKSALAQLPKAYDVPKQRVARYYLLAGDATKAEQLAREEVQNSPKQVVPLAELADVLRTVGKNDEARETFARLQAISQDVDLDAPPFARLAPLARESRQPVDWRRPLAKPADVGTRPPLDSLGPLRWQPTGAPDWTLPAADGSTLSLRQFAGKPLVVVFYLGSGCPHCVEQLKLFAAKAGQFSSAGITLLGIGSESPQELKAGPGEAIRQAATPLALLCDPGMDVFKAYRAYDDFEGSPLHGAYLIDGKGLIRWQDISFEPFKDVDFLLDEARRLLSMP